MIIVFKECSKCLKLSSIPPKGPTGEIPGGDKSLKDAFGSLISSRQLFIQKCLSLANLAGFSLNYFTNPGGSANGNYYNNFWVVFFSAVFHKFSNMFFTNQNMHSVSVIY